MSQALELANDSGVDTATQAQVHYAGFWIRVAAVLIDSMVFWITDRLIEFLSVPLLIHGTLLFNISFFSMSALFNVFYECCFLASPWMATPGMKAVGIKITDYDGKGISFGRAFGRYLAQFLSAIVFGIGFLIIAFDKRKQGWHDQIAKTFVVYNR
jgi:uncharacterized RDD family membrane protein YckC